MDIEIKVTEPHSPDSARWREIDENLKEIASYWSEAARHAVIRVIVDED